MVVMVFDLFTAIVGIIGFFSHLINKGLELFRMTREAMKLALDNTSIKRNLQRLQDLATAYRDRTLSQLGKDAIDDCVKSCHDTYGTIEEKLLKIQGSTTKFTRGLRAVWQSNALNELMSKMDSSNSKLRDVLIMSHLQAGLDIAVRNEVLQTEKSFAFAQSRLGQDSFENQDSSDHEEVSQGDGADDTGSLVRYNAVQASTRSSQNTKNSMRNSPKTTSVTRIYDGSVVGGDTIVMGDIIASQQQSRIRTMKATVKQTVEETSTLRRTIIEKSIECKFSATEPRRRTNLVIGVLVMIIIFLCIYTWPLFSLDSVVEKYPVLLLHLGVFAIDS